MLMFGRRNIAFILGLVVAVGLLVVVLSMLFSHSAKQTPPTPQPMAAYAPNPSAKVSLLIDGPTNAESLHNQVQISVTNSSATLNVYSGYLGTLLRTESYPNNEPAFHVFLRSLEYAGFNDGTNSPGLSQASGYCPLQDRYILTFNVNGVQKQRYWTTSCGSSDPETFKGDINLTLQLFSNQIPNYQQITSGLNI